MDSIFTGLTGETLIKLANVGTSGVCIFAVFWTGLMISRLGPKDPPEKYRTIRTFMGLCVAMAAISAWLTWELAKNGQQQITAAKIETATTKETVKELVATVEVTQQALQDSKKDFTTIQSQVASINVPPALKTQIDATAIERNLKLQEVFRASNDHLRAARQVLDR